MGDHVYTLIITALVILAIIDLVVGVSNDAVNFLNSAIGSKTISFKNILIVASIGVLFGALFSGGMMEVARKGIFVPSQFYFSDIMIIFITVMITDVLLLDFFNTIGIPTSTTVSIVFELLGASTAIALIKMSQNDQSIRHIFEYINTSKATEIILGIILSIIIAFTIGAIIQFLTRLAFTFKYEKKPLYMNVIFGSIATSCIVYFLLIKGLKNSSFLSKETLLFIKTNTALIISLIFALSTILSSFIIYILKKNIYKFIVVIGTFSLAMAFAGNDLVNFVGVPIAAWQSYDIWSGLGVASQELRMNMLESSVPTPTFFLMLSGVIMIITLWFSKKAKGVIKTSIDLADDNDTKERFKANFLSKIMVRSIVGTSNLLLKIIPKNIMETINSRFQKPKSRKKDIDAPAFDTLRASVNLMVSSILISIATSMKLPLSTTYVTFMVAMGTSFSDRAWGKDSAVYRVAGVLNVIGGWFMTAIIAFTVTGVMAYLIHLGGGASISMLLIAIILILYRNYKPYVKNKTTTQEDTLSKIENKTIKEIINESSSNVPKVIKRIEKIYTNVLEGLATQNLSVLKKTKKGVDKLTLEIEELGSDIYYCIQDIEEPSTAASSRFYILIVRYLHNFSNTIHLISKFSYRHIDNNHKGLTFKQLEDIRIVEQSILQILKNVKKIYVNANFIDIEETIKESKIFEELIYQKLEKQIDRTKVDESSPKNTTLYFNLLLESKEMIDYIIDLLVLYNQEYKKIEANN